MSRLKSLNILIALIICLSLLLAASCILCSCKTKQNNNKQISTDVVKDTVDQIGSTDQNNYSQISTDAAKDTVDQIGNTDQIQQINCDIENTEEYINLVGEVKSIEAYGKTLGFLMIDINSCKGIAYNIDFPWCAQSTIKAPYVASLLDWDTDVWTYWKDAITDIITLSDNKNYDDIREYYGNDKFANFLKSVDVDTKNAQILYPREITVRDMAKIWTKMYTLLNPKNDSTGIMTKFAKLFEHTVCSSTQDVLGRKYKTHCKTGWEVGLDRNEDGTLTTEPEPRMVDGNPENDEIATNDTGIVYAGYNPYILISFTDFAASPSYMYDFTEAIDAVHAVLVG